ncbi:MAG: hypothetical protein KDC98_03775, partial [Planctomycetes bacterium]|nr:hypothetical protein [Planctomycetota bacterium]
FATEPWLDLTVEAAGIDPTALSRVSPALAEKISGTESSLKVGFALHTELDLHRSDVARFDLSRPFGAAIVLTDFVVQNDAGDDLLAIAEVDAEARAIDPRSGAVLLRRVDIDSPRIAVTQSAEGLQVAGLLLKRPAEPAEPTAAPAAPEPATTAEPVPPGPEIAIDDLHLFGLDFTFRDTTTEPPTHLPIEDSDLELRRFTTRALTEPRPFAFKATLRGGQVELERRLAYSSLLTGILGSATDLVTGQNYEHEIERRPLLDELAVEGLLQLFPRTKGRIRTSLHGFEMQALRGLAKISGVDLTDGLLDADVAVDMQRSGTNVKSHQTFSFLQVSEPPGGPISTYLKLPAPLDAVLFLLRNSDGEQRIPLKLKVPPEGASTGGIASAAIEALTLLIGDAIASSPWRVLSTATDAVGLTGGEEDLRSRAIAMPCLAASAEADPTDLLALLDEFGDDETIEFVVTHELGAGDCERLTALANPAADLVQEGIARLRTRRDQLEGRRTDLAAEVAARFLAGQLHEAYRRHDELRQLDEQIGQACRSLDTALDRLDSDNERRRRRRTRAAMTELGELRLRSATAVIAARLGAEGGDRIKSRSPRAVVTAGVDGGGRVVVTPRRREP